jgi:hypothetical protein
VESGSVADRSLLAQHLPDLALEPARQVFQGLQGHVLLSHFQTVQGGVAQPDLLGELGICEVAPFLAQKRAELLCQSFSHGINPAWKCVPHVGYFARSTESGECPPVEHRNDIALGMRANWFYARGNDKHGPVLEEHLRGLLASGTLPRNVWPNENIDAPFMPPMDRTRWLNLVLVCYTSSAALGIWFGSSTGIENFLCIPCCILAILLRIWKRRVLATMLLLGTLCSLILTSLTSGLQWTSLLVAAFQIGILIKATQATFRINRHHLRTSFSLP